MKAYVSIDLEGLPGVSSLMQVAPSLPLYSDARRVMTWAANTVSKLLKENGFDRIVVADSHAYMANISYMDINVPIELIQGYPRPYSMVIGIEEGFDAAFFIGYHAAAGTLRGFLDHTYSSRVLYRVFVDGKQASEYLLNAYYAGYYGVPVALVAGDDHLRIEVEEYTPWAVFVPLKKGLSRISARYPSLGEAEKLLAEGVKEAARRLKNGELKPLKPKPLNIKVELREVIYADMAQLIPGSRRLDAYTIEYDAKNPIDALGFIELVAWVGLAGHMLVQSMYK
ncbi:MAG: M55 family metallopeptidase [Pyrodictiaceae archaeon]